MKKEVKSMKTPPRGKTRAKAEEKTEETARAARAVKTEICLLDIDYREINGRVNIVLYGKTAEGKRVVVVDPSYEPYFYVLPADMKKAKEEIEAVLKKEKLSIKGMETAKKIISGVEKEMIRISCFLPQDTGKIRDAIKGLEKKRGGSGSIIEEYEYAMSFYRSYLADRGISCLDWLSVTGKPFTSTFDADFALEASEVKKTREGPAEFRVLAFDTEVVEEKRGERQIIMLSLYGKDLRKVFTYKSGKFPDYVETMRDEGELIGRFVETVNEYGADIVAGFNSDLYDFVVLRERAAKLKADLGRLSVDGSGVTLSKRARFTTARLKGRVHIDIFNFVNNIVAPVLQTEVMSLDTISAEILGDEKIEMEYAEILEAWKEERNLEDLAQYCLKDSELTFRLARVLLPQIFEITRIVGQSLFDVSRMMYSQLVEWYYTRRAKEMNRVVPNQPKFEEIQERQKATYIGGYVKEPEAGIHENIAVIDFASLYPSILSTYNISIETLNCQCCKGDGHRVPEQPYWFCKKRKGFESQVIMELVAERKKLKGEMKKAQPGSVEHSLLSTRQSAVKTIANASYGYYGFAASKWYGKECAESITAFGRYWIKRTIEEAGKSGFNPVYGDTDSAFLGLGTKSGKELLKFLEGLNKELPGIMRIDLEDFYKRGIFIPKEIGGGTAKKRYALINGKGNLKIRGLERVRRDWSSIAKRTQEEILRLVLDRQDVKKAVSLVKDMIEKIRKRDAELKDLVVYEQITRPLKEYRVTAPHIAAAKKLIGKGIPVSEGSVVGFIIEKGKGSISEKATPVEFADLKKIDTDYYIDHQIIPASLRILKVLGIGEKEFQR